MSSEEPTTQIAPVESPQMVSTIKLHILKKGEYTLWSMRIEQYLTNTNYSLWQVILNGDSPIQVTTDENGVETEVPLKTAQAAIKSRFDGNVESKKMQMTVLKQQFEKFSVSDTEGLDKAYDRFQKLISLLEVHGVAVPNEDVNQKFLRALPSSWNNVALIMRNKDGIDDLDIDDLYNNLKVFEADIKGSPRSSSNSQNVAFISTEDTSSSNEVNTANGVSTASGHNSQGQASSSSYIDDLMLDALTVIEGAILQGNVERQEIKETGRCMGIRAGTTSEGLYQWRPLMHCQLSSKDKTGIGYGDQLNENDSSGSELFNNVFDSRSSDGDDNQTNDRFKKDNGYHVVPPPLTGNYMPPLADLSFAGLDDSVYRPTTNKTSASVSQVEANIIPPSDAIVEMPRVESVRPSGVIIEDWVSDDEDIFQSNDLRATDKPSFKRIEFTNATNKFVKPKQAKKPRITTQNPKRMAKKSVLKNIGKNSGLREIRPVWNSAQRINHQNKFVPYAVLTRFGRVPVSAAKQSSLRATTSTSTFRPVNTATHTNRVNVSKLRTNDFHRVNGVNTAGQSAVSTVKGTGVTAVKTSAGNPQQALKNKGIFDSGCSRHMIGNKDFLTDYQDIDGGFVAFGGSARGGKITGKGKIRTDKLDFKDVFFVKELKFNLFSVSQMCDKKNSVLFTKTECLVLSPDFKLLDASQVLLRVPRQSNMYNFDLKNVVPSGDLTCLFAKAIIDESKLWHRRLGHVNFKTMNKLVKGNLVRGLPSKIFENDHTCVACQKGKQHKASCKAKLVSSISQPLQMLHMDLFGPTSVRSINHKTYCLVVTDDFSRFSWVFFLASKDETSGILKRFITEIENQLNHKVKVIRCDNGTEFKNREMNEFYGLKGIKREFSIARTPQQNEVAKRKNMTLIEAARTMLADSLLPTVFWAEAVNTACYVLNRVLVTRPHNKTPYELIIGRPKSISFMRPFRCPVTILNTLDPLGKFDRKAEEGFLLGYSVNRKAFRVFNSQTRKVKENLHVNFLENKPNVAGQGPNWLFNIDSLTNSMNYQPVTAWNQTNKHAGPQEANGNTSLKQSVDAGQSEEKNVSTQQYIVFPLWFSISSSYKSSDENDTADDSAGESPVQKTASENEQALKNVLDKMMDQEKEATKQSDAVRKEFEAQCNRELFQGKDTKSSSTNSLLLLAHQLMLLVHQELLMMLDHHFAFDDEDLDTYNSPFADQVMGAEANFNNIEPSTIVSPIPTTIIHSIHPKDQIIGDPKSAVQTRSMSKKNSGEHAMIRWVEAMQEELIQFKIQKVWTLVDLPYGKKAISIKWVYRNKKDERGIVVKNKARLVAQEYKQEEGIDYDEVFAHVAKIEAISLFLAYASFMNIVVYQMDVKSIFLYGTIEEEMSSMGELTFFLGLQVKQKEDGIFISQDKYVGEILKKFGFSSVRTANTPMETNKALTKDEDGEDVDIHLYRSMIRSLMYLTSSRPDIMFSVYSDYAGASLDKKSTSGGCSIFFAQTRSERVLEKPNEPPLSEGYTSGSRKGRMEHQFELMANVPIIPHDSPLPGGYTPGSDEDDDLDKEDASKQGKGSNKILCNFTLCLWMLETEDESTMAFEIITFIKLMLKEEVNEYKNIRLYTSTNWIEVGSVERAITTVVSLDAAQDSDKIFKTQSTAMLNVDIPQGIDTARFTYWKFRRGRMEHQFELMANVPITPHDSPLPGGYTPGSDEGRLKLQELMTMCIKLSKQMLDLEKEKDAQTVEISRLTEQ
ncbi:putative ribonuclease H-like domain-containing protein [Tanacetum coccineum]